jgi:hypothetical protein
MTNKELESEIRGGPYAWPGGYPKYFVMTDGEPMCWSDVAANFKLVLAANKANCGHIWQAANCQVNWEDDSLFCCHCGQRIEAAYPKENE